MSAGTNPTIAEMVIALDAEIASWANADDLTEAEAQNIAALRALRCLLVSSLSPLIEAARAFEVAVTECRYQNLHGEAFRTALKHEQICHQALSDALSTFPAPANPRVKFGDFRTLIYAALNINDKLRLHADHAEFEGGMNDVEYFRDLVNRIHNDYFDELAEARDERP